MVLPIHHSDWNQITQTIRNDTNIHIYSPNPAGKSRIIDSVADTLLDPKTHGHTTAALLKSLLTELYPGLTDKRLTSCSIQQLQNLLSFNNQDQISIIGIDHLDLVDDADTLLYTIAETTDLSIATSGKQPFTAYTKKNTRSRLQSKTIRLTPPTQAELRTHLAQHTAIDPSAATDIADKTYNADLAPHLVNTGDYESALSQLHRHQIQHLVSPDQMDYLYTAFRMQLDRLDEQTTTGEVLSSYQSIADNPVTNRRARQYLDQFAAANLLDRNVTGGGANGNTTEIRLKTYRR